MPVVEVGLAGSKLRLLFHTGATLSCLREVDTRALRCVGVARDYYPGLGEFTTELRQVTLMFGDQQVSLECGLRLAIEHMATPVTHGMWERTCCGPSPWGGDLASVSCAWRRSLSRRPSVSPDSK
jgi:hypothetical protein